jgi:hypothetical protein
MKPVVGCGAAAGACSCPKGEAARVGMLGPRTGADLPGLHSGEAVREDVVFEHL